MIIIQPPSGINLLNKYTREKYQRPEVKPQTYKKDEKKAFKDTLNSAIECYKIKKGL